MIEDRFRRDDDWSISESSLEPGGKLVASPYRKKMQLFLAIFLIMSVSFFAVYLWLEEQSLNFAANEVYKLKREVALSQDIVEAVTSERDSALAEIERLESELDATENEVVVIQDTIEAVTSERDSALAEIERLESELAEGFEKTLYSPVESGTFTFMFGARLAEGPVTTKTKLFSFPFTRSAAPLVDGRIISDTIVPVFRSYPTVKQLNTIKWKRKNLAGYLNPQTELLVLKVIEVGDAFWVEACIVAGEDCGN